MPKVYATEPMMHAGNTYLPGESMEADVNDTAAILAAGRGTLDEKNAAVAAKQFAAAQKAAAAG
jgi:hypothetical protein